MTLKLSDFFHPQLGPSAECAAPDTKSSKKAQNARHQSGKSNPKVRPRSNSGNPCNELKPIPTLNADQSE